MGYFPSIKTQHGSVTIIIDSTRFEEQFREAQQFLGDQVLTDCTPNVPFLNGPLRESGKVLSGGEEVVWISPEARYLYYGMVMEGPAPKVVTDKPLVYHTAGTGPFWFEEAKSANLENWITETKKIAGGG